LTSLCEVRVLATEAATDLKRHNDLLTVARVCQLSHWIEGSILKSGNIWSMNVRLVSVEDGSCIWASTFRVRDSKLLCDCSDVAVQIARQVKLHWVPIVENPDMLREDVGVLYRYASAIPIRCCVVPSMRDPANNEQIACFAT
jgi:hypothetical protein